MTPGGWPPDYRRECRVRSDNCGRMLFKATACRAKLPVRRGASLRFPGHPPAPDLVNGGEAEILEIGYKRVRFRDGDREFGLGLTDPQLRHLDHAYCSTVHAAQGRTARSAIAVLDAGGRADRELLHVELSRVSEAFLLLTDDREALVERLEAHDGSEDGALEALGIDLAEPPVVDPEVFAALEHYSSAVNTFAARQQRLADMEPDEAGGPGHEDRHPLGDSRSLRPGPGDIV